MVYPHPCGRIGERVCHFDGLLSLTLRSLATPLLSVRYAVMPRSNTSSTDTTRPGRRLWSSEPKVAPGSHTHRHTQKYTRQQMHTVSSVL
jgi:hypothetical protein